MSVLRQFLEMLAVWALWVILRGYWRDLHLMREILPVGHFSLLEHQLALLQAHLYLNPRHQLAATCPLVQL